MKSKNSIENRLAELEKRITEQMSLCVQHGFDSHHSLFLDGRLVERKTLRWVLGKKHKPFNQADVMAGW